MQTTRPSLLQRLRMSGDQDAWREFVALYQPLLGKYARRRGLNTNEAEEVAQSCMAKLSRTMGTFEYSRGRGSFKSYLFVMVTNAIANAARGRRLFRAGTDVLDNLKKSKTATDEQWDLHWLKEHLRYAIDRLEVEFTDSTIAAFKLYALQEWSVEKVCHTLGMTPNQVYLAKSRVTSRLRRELKELVGHLP